MVRTLTNNQVNKLKMVLASKDLFGYCQYVDSEDFYNEEEAPYLKEICDTIQEFENDDNEALFVLMPPRHGKTRTVNNAVDWLLGKNPKYKIMEGCYNTQLSRRSSKIVRDRIQQKEEEGKIVFHQVFPKVTIKDGSGSIDNWGVTGNQEDNYLATAPNAGATGIGCDFLILDDTIKNKYEAYNKEILRKIFEDWFKDTLYSRLEGKRKIIVVMTRWSTKDIAGQLMEMLKEQGRKFKVIKKKAYDPETGKMLNPKILNKEQYDLLIQTIGEDIVRANYDQEPVDIKGRLYTYLQEYNPEDIRSINNPNGTIQFREIRGRADTADQRKRLFINGNIWSNSSKKSLYIRYILYSRCNGNNGRRSS